MDKWVPMKELPQKATLLINGVYLRIYLLLTFTRTQLHDLQPCLIRRRSSGSVQLGEVIAKLPYPTTLKTALFNSSLRLLHPWTIRASIWRSAPEISVNISVNASIDKPESLMFTRVLEHGVSGSIPATSTKVSMNWESICIRLVSWSPCSFLPETWLPCPVVFDSIHGSE